MGVQEKGIWGVGGGGGTLTEISFHIRPLVPRVTPAPAPGLFADQLMPVIAVFAATFAGHAHCPSMTREASRTPVKSRCQQRTAIAPCWHSYCTRQNRKGRRWGGHKFKFLSFSLSHSFGFCLYVFLFVINRVKDETGHRSPFYLSVNTLSVLSAQANRRTI